MILYWLLKIPVFVTLRVYFKRLVFNKSHLLAHKGPVIIAANHTNALVDPIIFGSQLLRPVNFLARGDVFKSPFVAWILKQIKIAPIFRLEEGADQLHKNEITFVRCNELLKDGEAVLIFPEALCVQERRIRKLRKGMARIAFRAEEQNDFKLGLQVLPVGINYSNQNKFRSTLFINYGEPVLVNSYKELYLKDKARAMNELTREVEKRMQGLVVDIHFKNDEELFCLINEQQHQPVHSLLPQSIDLRENFKKERHLSQLIAKARSLYPEKTDALHQQIKEYDAVLKKYNIKDFLIRDREQGVFFKTIFVGLGWPLYLLGYILNYPPLMLGKLAAKKMVKHIEFYASIVIAVNMFSYNIYFMLFMLIAYLFIHQWTSVILIGSGVVLSGVFAMYFFPHIKKIRGRWRMFQLKRNKQTVFDELVNKRTALQEEVRRFLE